jgi:hypothetical protein
MAGSSGIVAVRYPAADLELIEAARNIMGQTISQFTRSASIALAKAIIEAAADARRPAEMIIPLHFTVDGVQYRWLAAWQYGQEERTINITAFGRDPTTIL